MDSTRTRFAALLDTHRGIVFKVANAYCRHPDDRQDLVQEIAAQLWRAYPGYDPARPFTTWMYRIALNVAISHVRSDARQAPLVSIDDHEAPAGPRGERNTKSPPSAASPGTGSATNSGSLGRPAL